MNEDSIDFDVPEYTTQWSQMQEQKGNKPKRATYSRRGSLNMAGSGGASSRRQQMKMGRRSSTGSAAGFQPLSSVKQSPTFEHALDEDRVEEENNEWDRRLSGASASDRNGESPFENPPPVPARKRIFRRANSVNGTSEAPKAPPMLKRSQSVSTASVSTMAENFSPNLFDPLEESASPKRGYTSSIGGPSRGRKKSKATYGRKFSTNDFSPLGQNAPNFDSPQVPTMSSGKSSTRRGRFLQRGNSLPVFPSPCFDDDEAEEDDQDTFDFPSKLISPRKRRPSQLFLDDVGASPFPRQATAKAMTASPGMLETSLDLPTPLNEFQDRNNMFNAVASSDDDTVMSNSDISEGSDDDGHLAMNSHSERKVCATRERRILQPENATVEDVLETMPSEEDVRFLVRAMTMERKQRGKSRLWQVVPNADWPSERRNALLRWATETLGFKFYNGGGDLSILQILLTKGEPLLTLLKTTVDSWDYKRFGGCKPKPEHSVPHEFFVSPRPAKSFARTQPSNVLKTDTPINRLPRSAAADSLLKDMENLTVVDKPPLASSTLREDVMLESDLQFEGIGGPARPSLDHHASSSDLMHHMHGTTPIRPRQQGKPPRLSLQSVASNVSMASPFPVTSFLGDFASTPRIDEPSDDSWGSNPVDGRDWGASEPCDESILRPMLSDLEKACMPEGGGTDTSNVAHGGHNRKPSFFDQINDEAVDESGDDGDAVLEGSSSSETSEVAIQEHVNDKVQFSIAEEPSMDPRETLRRQKHLAMRRRTALFASAKNPVKTLREARKSMFVSSARTSTANALELLPESSPEFFGAKALGSAKKINSRRSVLTTESPLDNSSILERIFDFMKESELLLGASLVSRKWFEAATHSHANLMLLSVGCDGDTREDGETDQPMEETNHALTLMERPWNYITSTFPWACFLSEGAYKRVFKVFNHKFRVEEAISIMDVEEIRSTGNMNVVGAELAVSVMLSSLVRRGICPNFVSIRGVFSCPFEPPRNQWGWAENKAPRGKTYLSPKSKRQPKEPKKRGQFQYIRMELCTEGDAEEFLKRQPEESLTPVQARNVLFQIAFALHAGADKFSLKHYDLKLLNVFMQRVTTAKKGEIVMRYGLGEHVFSLRAPQEETVIAKLADYGTAKVDTTSNGQQVTIAQFTTFENTPPDFMILGDEARQGHGHDNFGLGLCMLHLFTGHAPYEEILQDIECPPNLKEELRKIWEDEEDLEYTIIRSLVLSEVFKDDDGHILEGEPDENLYHTLYRYLVLFGVPEASQQRMMESKVMSAIKATLLPGTQGGKTGRGGSRIRKDTQQFNRDRRQYSLSHGTNRYIARARAALMSMDGGMELLLSLVHFNPQYRASALNVLNSPFMVPLREMEGYEYSNEDEVMSFTALSTQASANQESM